MSRYNKPDARAAVRSPVTSVPSGRTREGAQGYARGDAKSELFLLAVSYLGSDGSFYESAQRRNNRLNALIREVAVADPEWMRKLITWLRGPGSMRTAPLVTAAESVKALVDAKVPGGRALVSAALRRGDEPGEMLAYWHAHYGRNIPKPLKRGIADAVTQVYTEYSLLKYDTDAHAYRFGDVIEQVHPSPRAPAGERYEVRYEQWQGDLFRHAIDRRHSRGKPVPESLKMVRASARLRAAAAADPQVLLDADALSAAGMTWQNALSLAGSKIPKKDLWTALIPSMGYEALLKNLRNFDDAKVSDAVAAAVAARLADPEQAARSGQFPFRFLSAYRAVSSLRWSYPLEQALNASLANVPELSGRTLVLVDRSPSMWDQKFSAHSDMPWADAAAVFGAAVALRAEHADLAEFGVDNAPVAFRGGESVLKLVERFGRYNGTDIPSAVKKHFRDGFHTRVVIVTDEQSRPGYLPSNARYWGGMNGMPETLIDDLIPQKTPLYMWNFGGYAKGVTPSGSGTRVTLGGLSDSAFRIIPLLEAGRDASWDELFKPRQVAEQLD